MITRNIKIIEFFFYLIIIFYFLYSGAIYYFFVPENTQLNLGLFRDWKVVINDIYCKEDCRPFRYGPSLLYLPFLNLLEEFYYQIFPNLLIIFFILSIFIIFNKFHEKNRLLIFCIILSPTSLLAIERGNFDLLLFIFAFLICYNRFLYINIFLISFSFLAKYYPVTYFLNIFTHKKNNSFLKMRIIFIITLILSALILYFHKEIFLGALDSSSASKAGYHMLFSIKATAKVLKYIFSINYILLLIITYLSFFIIIYLFVKYLYKNKINENLSLDKIEDKLFLIGTNTILFNYLIFSNYYYREIFLILSLPILIKLKNTLKIDTIKYFIYFIIFRYLFLHVYNYFILNENFTHINGIRVFYNSFLTVFTIKSILDFILMIVLSGILFFYNFEIFKILFNKKINFGLK